MNKPYFNFIQKSQLVHNNKYDYSKVEYVNAITKVCIVCPIHGEFWQTPNAHLNGCGCPICGKIQRTNKRRDTTETFIEKAKKVHGNKYDYSKVEYVDSQTKVCIICPIHGEFWQTPNAHLSGHGCPQCKINKASAKRTMSLEEFLSKVNKIHNNKYTYPITEYRPKSFIKIICPIHGEFTQNTQNHLAGQGCPECAKIQRKESQKLTIDEFLKRAKEIHGDKYDYSKVNYINTDTKVCIICSIHGEFWQTPYHHINRKQGCPKCNKSYKLTTETFIEKAKKVHGNKYDYSKVEYVNSKTKVCIICPIHGEFWVSPVNHLFGNGCPKCRWSILERTMTLILANKKINFKTQYKTDWLGTQSLDFYLPDYNVAIECQGEQHFQSCEFFGGDESFKIQTERDLRKKQLCEEQGIKILYYTNVKLPKNFNSYHVYTNIDELFNEITKS